MTNKLHLGVYGVIVEDNAILLIKKARGPYTGTFDLPGGKLEHGESIVDGLSRELREEIGIDTKDFSLIDNYTWKVDFDYEGESISMHHVGLVYRVHDFDVSKINQDITFEDVEGCKFYAIKDLKKEDLSPFANFVINNLRFK